MGRKALTIKQASDDIEIGEKQIRKFLRAGYIRNMSVQGRKIVFSEKEIERFLDFLTETPYTFEELMELAEAKKKGVKSDAENVVELAR